MNVFYIFFPELKYIKIKQNVRLCLIIVMIYQSSSCEALVVLFSAIFSFFCLNAATRLLLGISTCRHPVEEKDNKFYQDCN